LALRPTLRLALCALLLLGVAPRARAQGAAAWRWHEDEAEAQTDISLAVAPRATGSLQVAFCFEDEANTLLLELSPSGLKLQKKQAGRGQVLAVAARAWESGETVVVQKRAWMLRVLVGGRVALTAFDEGREDGRVGVRGSGGWEARDLRVQPVEDIAFADDWTRGPGENGDWTVDSGPWQLSSSAATVSSRNAAMSANPFAFVVHADPAKLALARAGRRFWDNYHAQVSVRPEPMSWPARGAQGEVGLAAYVQDASNFLAFRWSGSESKSARRLVRVANGREQVLAAAPGAWVGQVWYRIGLRLSPGWIEAFVDGEPILRARDDSWGQGGVALLARGTHATFDDASVRSAPLFHAEAKIPAKVPASTSSLPNTAGLSGWTPDQGRWQSAAGDADLVQSLPTAQSGGRTRLLVSGRADWSGYILAARARAGAAGACGLAVGVLDDKNFAVFRWAGPRSPLPFRGRRQLLRYLQGRATVVSDEPLGQLEAGGGWAHLQVSLEGGAVRVRAGGASGEVLAQHADVGLASGRVALWAQGMAPVSFDEVSVAFPPEESAPRVSERMEGDAFMAGWASSAGDWQERNGPNGEHERWAGGEFFNSATLEIPWRREALARGVLDVALGAREFEFESGLVLQVRGAGDGTRFEASLSRGGKVLASGGLDWAQAVAGLGEQERGEARLLVSRAGGAVAVAANGHSILTARDAGPSLSGTRLAVRTKGMALNAQSMNAGSANREDYLFSQAPADWYGGGGTWKILERWPCFSDWSFFGGQGAAPILWNKRVLAGDVSAQAWVHNTMDLPKELAYSAPGNFNITLCGDGASPASGYAFVFAGKANTWSAILRDGQVLAQRTAPEARVDRPTNHFLHFHKRWFLLRAQARREVRDGKAGVHLTLFAGGQKIVEAFDERPPASFGGGGRAAFWGLGESLLLARATLEAQHLGGKYLPASFAAARRMAFEPPPDAATLLAPNSLVPTPLASGESLPPVALARATVDGAPALKLVNTLAGGKFAVLWTRPGAPTLDEALGPGARLEFEARLPDEARLDLYATIDGRRHLLEISGTQKPDAAVPLLGHCDRLRQSDGWTRYTLALGALLAERFGDKKKWQLSALTLGAEHGDGYRWAGFGGNPAGMQVLVRSLKLHAGQP
jgi:hypothetical protein